jgi:hypothetical protein
MKLVDKTKGILREINVFLLGLLGIQNRVILVPVRVQRKRFNQ